MSTVTTLSPKKGLLSADTWSYPPFTFVISFSTSRSLFLLAAVLLLPRFLFLLTNHNESGNVLTYVLSFLGIALGSFAFGFVISELPSKSPEKIDGPDSKAKAAKRSLWKSETGVLAAGVFPLLGSGFFSYYGTSGHELQIGYHALPLQTSRLAEFLSGP